MLKKYYYSQNDYNLNPNKNLIKIEELIYEINNTHVVFYKLDFENGKPKIKYDIELYIMIDEIIEAEKTDNLLHTENWFVDDSVVDGLQTKIKQNLDNIVTKLKDQNMDIIDIYDKFYKFKHKKFTTFLNTLENEKDFLKNVIFDYKITINSSY